jgi:hypothetical protein
MPKLKLHSTGVYDLQEEKGNVLIDNTGLNCSLKPDINSAVKLTIQPDFSDTPLDSETNVYNNKYPPMIDENRSFFIEDYDLLAAKSKFWYTRQIINPLIALRYNHTGDGSAIAILALKDKKMDGITGSGDYWMAAGYSKNLGKQQVIFNAYTRWSEDWKDYNTLGYLVLGIRPWQRFVINPELSYTYDRETVSSLTKVGYTGKLETAWQGKHIRIMGTADFISKGFTARMGSVNETNMANLAVQLGYERDLSSLLNSVSSQLVASDTYDLEFEENHYRSISLSSSCTTYTNALTANYSANYASELYIATKHHVYSHFFSLSSTKYRVLMPTIMVSYGRSLIYDQYRTANYFSISPDIWTEINQNTSLSLGAYYIKYDTEQTDNFDKEYFYTNLNLQTRFVDKISITQGIRLNNYTSNIASAADTSSTLIKNGYIGYYVNIDWRVTNHLNLIAGFKSRETRYRMGEERQLAIDDQNVHLKVEYLF